MTARSSGNSWSLRNPGGHDPDSFEPHDVTTEAARIAVWALIEDLKSYKPVTLQNQGCNFNDLSASGAGCPACPRCRHQIRPNTNAVFGTLPPPMKVRLWDNKPSTLNYAPVNAIALKPGVLHSILGLVAAGWSVLSDVPDLVIGPEIDPLSPRGGHRLRSACHRDRGRQSDREHRRAVRRRA
jgi:hypothetical protein